MSVAIDCAARYQTSNGIKQVEPMHVPHIVVTMSMISYPSDDDF